MAIAQSKLTRQGQISVPAEVRRKLGIGPGSVIEWVEVRGQLLVRHAGRYSSEEIHQALFPEGVRKAVSVASMKAGLGELARKRRARGRF